MADEEEVIFRNSPLYQHLSEVGFTDFDVHDINSTSKQPEVKVSASSSLNSGRNSRNRSLHTKTFLECVKQIYGCILWMFSPSLTEKEVACYASYISLIKSSDLLTDDDMEVVYRFEQCALTKSQIASLNINASCDTRKRLSKHNLQDCIFSSVTSTGLIGFVTITAVMLGIILTTNSYPSLDLCTTMGIFLILFFIYKLFCLCWNKRMDYLAKSTFLLLNNYLKLMEELLLLIRKAILFIQERELLVRGHVIISPVAPVTRMESNSAVHGKSIKQCFMLRKCIFNEVKEYISILDKKTKVLSSTSLFDGKMLNWFDTSLTRMDKDQVKLGLSSDTELETDEVLLALLKNILHSLFEQQSLLLCVTILNLLHVSVVTSLGEFKKIQDHHSILQSCFEHVLYDGKKCYETIQKCYKFHKIGFPANDLGKEKRRVLGNRLGSTFSPLFMAIHSLGLHLQEALKMSISIEDNLEGCDSLDKFVMEHVKEFKTKLMQLRKDVDNATACLDESQNRLEHIIQSSKGEKKVKGCSMDEKPSDNSTDHHTVQILDITGNTDVIPDQVFEGETVSEINNQNSYLPFLDREELLKEQKAREESQYLLQELKSVLATKDQDIMVGIPRALLSNKSNEDECVSNVEEKADLVSEKNSRSLSQSSESDKEQSGDAATEFERNSHNYCDDRPEKFSQFTSSDSDINDRANDCDIDNGHGVVDSDGTDVLENKMSFANPFASMVAAAAIARQKEFGLKEQSYEAKSFGDESNSDAD